MRRVTVVNETREKFLFLKNFISDPNKNDSETTGTDSCQHIGPKQTQYLGFSDAFHSALDERYIAFHLILGPSSTTPQEPTSQKALVLMIRFRKELTGTAKAFLVSSTVDCSVFPQPLWSTASKYHCNWMTAHKKKFTILLERRGWKKLVLKITETTHDNSPIDAISTRVFEQIRIELGRQVDIKFVTENERKKNTLGRASYSKGSLKMYERGPYTDFFGNRLSSWEEQTLPSPSWIWESTWEPIKIENVTDDEGWMYACSWCGKWKAERSFGKLVRRRVWSCLVAAKQEPEVSHLAPSSARSSRINSAHKHIEDDLDSRITRDFIAGVVEKGFLPDDYIKRLKDISFLRFKIMIWNNLKEKSLDVNGKVETLLRAESPRLFR